MRSGHKDIIGSWKSLWKVFPIETYAIFSVYMTTFVIVLAVNAVTHQWDYHIDPRQLLMGPMAGGRAFHYSTLAVYCYGVFILLRYFTGDFGVDKTSRGISRAIKDKRTFAVARSTVYWFLISSAFVFGSSAILSVLFQSFSYEAMGKASDLLMHMDKSIFGVYPPFYLNALNLPSILSWLILTVYVLLPATVGMLLAFLFCTEQQLFRSCFLAVSAATILSLPFWIAIPAISPNEMYRHNLLEQTMDPEIAQELQRMQLAPYVAVTLTSVEGMWIDKTGKSFSVSTFPSTHVIWATFFVYYLYRMRPRYAIPAALLFVLNFIGTMLVLEHYAVDAFFGIVIGILSIYAAERMLRFERTYLVDRYGLLSVFEAVRLKWVRGEEHSARDVREVIR